MNKSHKSISAANTYFGFVMPLEETGMPTTPLLVIPRAILVAIGAVPPEQLFPNFRWFQDPAPCQTHLVWADQKSLKQLLKKIFSQLEVRIANCLVGYYIDRQRIDLLDLAIKYTDLALVKPALIESGILWKLCVDREALQRTLSYTSINARSFELIRETCDRTEEFFEARVADFIEQLKTNATIVQQARS